MVFATQVWHYWIAVALVLGVVLVIVALVVAYLMTVERPRYPRRGQEAPPPLPSER